MAKEQRSTSAGFVAGLEWQDWPADNPTPPDWQAVQRLSGAAEQHVGGPAQVALLGSAYAGARGRFGVVGQALRQFALEPQPGAIAALVDQRPQDCIRVLLLGYEMGTADSYLAPAKSPRTQPAGMCFDLQQALVVDHQERRLGYFGAAAHTSQGQRPPQYVAPSQQSAPPGFENGLIGLTPAITDAEHKRRILACQEHIARGDIYQANLTRRLQLSGPIDAPASLLQLMEKNPVAHGALIQWQHGGLPLTVLSNSMETLLTYDAHSREARSLPIKGTCARPTPTCAQPMPSTPLENPQHRLILDPKERAEHVMIVDLVRNDLGRVATPGSVRVPKLMSIEPYRGVFHGVSDVRSTLDANHSPGELLAAVFPGGSITGAPKRRAMQLIAELESEPRGFYTGSIVLIWPDGSISASILIRTIVQDEGGFSLNVGGGIVADSVPEREIAETWEKVQVFAEVLRQSAP